MTKIEYVINPDGTPGFAVNCIVGCLHACGKTTEHPEGWCYARGQAKRAKNRCIQCWEFYPHSHIERIHQIIDRKKPATYFLTTMWDFGCLANPQDALNQIVNVTMAHPRHRYILLTKAPHNLFRMVPKYMAGKNVAVGVSVTCQEDVWRIGKLKEWAKSAGFGGLLIVSFEPLLGEITDVDLSGIDWITLGAQTGRGKDKVVPETVWVLALDAYAHNLGIPTFSKNNLFKQGMPLKCVESDKVKWQQMPIAWRMG